MKTNKMKAYQVHDREGYSDYSCVVFAETRGKAISNALGTDEFPFCDWDYIQLTAWRRPQMDKYYCGKTYMDWYDMDDRIALVKDCGYRCEDADYNECLKCQANVWCEEYERLRGELDE